MKAIHRRFNLAALSATSLLLAGSGCAADAADSEEPGLEMVLRGTAQELSADTDAPLRVAVRWSTEADVPGVYIQIDDVDTSGANRGAFDLSVAQPPPEVIEYESDGDYYYTSAQPVLLDNEELADGWVEAQLLADSEVGRSQYNIYFVDRDIPASAQGHFGIGPVPAGFHLIERQPDRIVYDDEGRVSGGIAVWEEIPLDTEIEIEVGSDGDPTEW
jgi:hypothetical protein